MMRNYLALVLSLGLTTAAYAQPAATTAPLLAAQTTPVENPDDDDDGDGLSNARESQLGTKPGKPDTDGDGLLDGWEVDGVPPTSSSPATLDLKSLGASPTHRDVFVWMDYMVRPHPMADELGLAPSTAVVEKIQAQFARGAVSNPDGIDGISIHLITGKEVEHVPSINFGDDGDDWSQFDRIRTRLTPQQLRVFHQMVWADTYQFGDETTTSSGYADVSGQFFVVTLGAWNSGTGGTDNQKIGTFIHELGHNFGLRHGSNESANNKPNHVSVMNYTYQTRGQWHDIRETTASGGVGTASCPAPSAPPEQVPPDASDDDIRFGYQHMAITALDENHLDERTGLGSAQEIQQVRVYYCNRWWESGAPIDWNRNGHIDSDAVSFDINPTKFGESTGQVILSATPNEWAILNYRGGAIGLPLAPRSCGANVACPAEAPFPLEDRATVLKDLRDELTEEVSRRPQ